MVELFRRVTITKLNVGEWGWGVEGSRLEAWGVEGK